MKQLKLMVSGLVWPALIRMGLIQRGLVWLGLVWLPCGCLAPAQTGRLAAAIGAGRTLDGDCAIRAAVASMPAMRAQAADQDGTLSAGQERRAIEILLNLLQKEVVSTAEAMPADKY